MGCHKSRTFLSEFTSNVHHLVARLARWRLTSSTTWPGRSTTPAPSCRTIPGQSRTAHSLIRESIPVSYAASQHTMTSHLRLFTLSFRSFSPLPNTLEFHPGQDYYFISRPPSSSSSSSSQQIPDSCPSHNMKLMFKVLDTRGDVGEAMGSVAEERQGSLFF